MNINFWKWTRLVKSIQLLFSFVFSDRQTLLSVNAPANGNLPYLFLYQLTRGVSTHWRATCSYDKYGINNYKDCVRGKFAAADIFAFLGSGVSQKKNKGTGPSPGFATARSIVHNYCLPSFLVPMNRLIKHRENIGDYSNNCDTRPAVGAPVILSTSSYHYS